MAALSSATSYLLTYWIACEVILTRLLNVNGPSYVQWNIAIYEDLLLYIVPGSHNRIAAQDEANLTPAPQSCCVELGPGDGVV